MTTNLVIFHFENGQHKILFKNDEDVVGKFDELSSIFSDNSQQNDFYLWRKEKWVEMICRHKIYHIVCLSNDKLFVKWSSCWIGNLLKELLRIIDVTNIEDLHENDENIRMICENFLKIYSSKNLNLSYYVNLIRLENELSQTYFLNQQSDRLSKEIINPLRELLIDNYRTFNRTIINYCISSNSTKTVRCHEMVLTHTSLVFHRNQLLFYDCNTKKNLMNSLHNFLQFDGFFDYSIVGLSVDEYCWRRINLNYHLSIDELMELVILENPSSSSIIDDEYRRYQIGKYLHDSFKQQHYLCLVIYGHYLVVKLFVSFHSLSNKLTKTMYPNIPPNVYASLNELMKLLKINKKFENSLLSNVSSFQVVNEKNLKSQLSKFSFTYLNNRHHEAVQERLELIDTQSCYRSVIFRNRATNSVLLQQPINNSSSILLLQYLYNFFSHRQRELNELKKLFVLKRSANPSDHSSIDDFHLKLNKLFGYETINSPIKRCNSLKRMFSFPKISNNSTNKNLELTVKDEMWTKVVARRRSLRRIMNIKLEKERTTVNEYRQDNYLWLAIEKNDEIIPMNNEIENCLNLEDGMTLTISVDDDPFILPKFNCQ
ncbi:hypothetical protein SNEBB_008542 [Seison nebaliae]|nr:hypothetical protein SNEBB_008542 [Seison nebaliae]